MERLVCQGEQARRVGSVCQNLWFVVGLNRARFCRSLQGGVSVHKNYATSFRNGFSHFREQLMPHENFDVRQIHVGDSFRHSDADAVITTQGVAVANYQKIAAELSCGLRCHA